MRTESKHFYVLNFMDTTRSQTRPEISTAVQEKFASGVKGCGYLHARADLGTRAVEKVAECAGPAEKWSASL